MVEPILKQLWRAWRMKHEDVEPTGAANALVERIPAEVTSFLAASSAQPPILRMLVGHYLAEKSLSLDARVMEQVVRIFEAKAQAIRASTDVERAAHERQRIAKTLGQESDLQDAMHQTALLGEQVAQHRLRNELLKGSTVAREEELARLRIDRKITELVSGSDGKAWGPKVRDMLTEVEDVIGTSAQIASEVRDRTDISEESKQASLAWLQEVTIEEVRRRAKNSSGDPEE